MKDKNLNIRISENTIKFIKNEAEKYNVSMSKFIRAAVILVRPRDLIKHLLKDREDRK